MLSTAGAWAQAPGKINYQAVARNVLTGEELSNQQVYLQALVRMGGPSGEAVYQEEHENIITNTFGLFNIFIGGGEALLGNLTAIDWATGTYWLEIEIDAGNGLQSAGSMQLVAVPYAFHANTVSNADDADADPTNELITQFEFDSETASLLIAEGEATWEVDLTSLAEDADADPTNELITQFEFDTATANLLIAEGESTWEVDLTSLAEDADADPTNELLTAVSFDEGSSTLTLQDSGGTYNLDLSSLINDADADPNNERINAIFYNAASNTLTVSEGGQNYSTGLGALNNDTDPTNELIDANGLVLTDEFVLQISEAGIIHSVDLSPLSDAGGWTKVPNESVIYNANDNVGIGTSSPSAQLHVQGPSAGNDVLLKVQSGSDDVLRVAPDTVATGNNSVFRINGQENHHLTVINNVVPVNYQVGENERFIICNTSFGFNGLAIDMPDASTCAGRIITIRRVGAIPIFGTVTINFVGSQLDFGASVLSLNTFVPETATLVSMGALGWTRLEFD